MIWIDREGGTKEIGQDEFLHLQGTHRTDVSLHARNDVSSLSTDLQVRFHILGLLYHNINNGQIVKIA